jgi:rhamnosyltransferase
MPKSVSVIIPTLNGGPLFAQVLAALRAQRYDGPVDLHIIDSGSTDDTLQIARDAGASVTIIDRSQFNHGLTRNRGIENSTGEILLLITQDALPADPQLLANLIRNYDDPAVGGVFARQIPRPEHDVLIQRRIRNWIAGSDQRREVQLTDRAAYDALTPMDKFLTCVFDNVCSSLRRTAWQQVRFRATAFGEDIDWSKRALEAGWKIVFEPAAAVIHSHRRPIAYEYKRTYQCHRKLYELFALQTIPAPRHVLRSLLHGISSDLRYVAQHEKTLARKLSLMIKVPLLVSAGVLGQYRGARDERLQQGKSHPDV